MSVLAVARPTPDASPAAVQPRRRAGANVALAALVVVSCLLAAAYSVITPAFEAPDEPGHYAYVEWLLDGHGVPLQGMEQMPWQPEFSQPPLYYLLEAPLAWLAGREPANLPNWEAHHNPWQNRTAFGNVNLYYHQPSESFPWTGAVLGLHLMRLGNVLFLALAIACIYGSARELGLPPWLGLFAASIAALIPQVLFMTGALNADNAIWSISAGALYLLLRWLRRGPQPLLAAVLGLAAGAAALSKLSGLAAVGLMVVFMGLRTLRLSPVILRRRGDEESVSLAKAGNGSFASLRMTGAGGMPSWRAALGDVVIATAMAYVVAGWWYTRNWALLGDPLGWQAMLPATGAMLRQTPLNLGAAALDLAQRGATGIGVFGWTNIALSRYVYLAFAAAAGAALVGLLAASYARRKSLLRLDYLLVIVWPVAFFISLARWVDINTAADQWRLLFPAYPALAILLAAGLWRLVESIRQAALLAPACLAALNVGILALVLAPAYAGPELYAGRIDHILNARYDDFLQLVGYSTPQPLDAKPGQTVEVDLFWHVLAPVPLDYGIDFGVLDSQGRLTWKEASSPDEGRAPMTLWKPDQLILDRHRIATTAEMSGSQKILISLFRPVPPGDHVPAIGPDGKRLNDETAEITRFLVLPARTPPATASDNVAFGDHLQLSGHTFSQSGGQLNVILDWKASGVPSRDYTVFVHLVAPDGRVVAQHDGQPNGGEFPTSLLASGVGVPDTHPLDIAGVAGGQYQVELGLYQLSSGERLATQSGDTSVSLPVLLTGNASEKPSP